MVQLVAGFIGVVAVSAYAWTAIRLSSYPTPWSLPWQSGPLGGRRWPALNAAIRFAVLAGVVVVVAWPYVQVALPAGWIHETGRGWFPSDVVHHTTANLTWLVIVLVVAGLVAIGILIAWLLPARRDHERIPDAQKSETLDEQTLNGITDETLRAVTRERDPRRAILACYALMERGLAIHGVPRNADETALEYLRRLLELAGTPKDPLRTLTALFHLAGFSTQPIDESMRETALSALQTIGTGTP